MRQDGWPNWQDESHWGFQLVNGALARLGQPPLVDNPTFRRDAHDLFPVFFTVDQDLLPLRIDLAPLQIDIDYWPEVVSADYSVMQHAEWIVDEIVRVFTSRCVMKHAYIAHTLSLFRPGEDEPWSRHIGFHLGGQRPSRVCGPLFDA